VRVTANHSGLNCRIRRLRIIDDRIEGVEQRRTRLLAAGVVDAIVTALKVDQKPWKNYIFGLFADCSNARIIP
jgi:hypothetical protein